MYKRVGFADHVYDTFLLTVWFLFVRRSDSSVNIVYI